MNEEQLKYPVGKFKRPTGPLSAEERSRLIDVIAAAPKQLADAVKGLSEQQLDTPYRPGGWTVRQVVHHVPDSHLNAYTRVKLALTENAPTIKPYDEGAWANLIDSKVTPVEVSLTLNTALHDRWVRLLRTLTPHDCARTMTHPEHGPITIDFIIALYGWHGPHHVAHITSLRKREGW
jgi:hypothetical protein